MTSSPPLSPDSKSKKSTLKGMKIRDEFVCPITYELLREPVVGSDGHTYEKEAIEKWYFKMFVSFTFHLNFGFIIRFKNRRDNSLISPRNGELMSNTTIPNLNLKKLIQDLIFEVSFMKKL